MNIVGIWSTSWLIFYNHRIKFNCTRSQECHLTAMFIAAWERGGWGGEQGPQQPVSRLDSAELDILLD